MTTNADQYEHSVDEYAALRSDPPPLEERAAAVASNTQAAIVQGRIEQACGVTYAYNQLYNSSSDPTLTTMTWSSLPQSGIGAWSAGPCNASSPTRRRRRRRPRAAAPGTP